MIILQFNSCCKGKLLITSSQSVTADSDSGFSSQQQTCRAFTLPFKGLFYQLFCQYGSLSCSRCSEYMYFIPKFSRLLCCCLQCYFIISYQYIADCIKTGMPGGRRFMHIQMN